MKPKLKKLLDIEQSKERKRWLFIFLTVFGGMGVYGALFFTFSTEKAYGALVNLTVVHTEEGSQPMASVKLQTGTMVIATLPKGLRFKHDAKVMLLVRRSFLGGFKYSVAHYTQ